MALGNYASVIGKYRGIANCEILSMITSFLEPGNRVGTN